MNGRIPFVMIGMLILVRLTAAADPRDFLQRYCVECHGEQLQEGDRRLDRLQGAPADFKGLEGWQAALDQINRGTMPPEDARQPQPNERVIAARRITELLRAAAERLNPASSATVLRRLNRFEYDRSVRQMLSLQEMLTDPTGSFPPDEKEQNFRNIGSSQVLSDFLLSRYLEAASKYLQAAVHPAEQPKARSWRFVAPFCPTGNRHDGKDRPGQYQHVRKNYHDAGGFLWIRKFTQGVPYNGNYRIRIRAEAIGRNYPYPERILRVPKADPLRMEVIATAARYGALETNNPSDRRIAEFELADNVAQWYELEAWLDKGFQPRIAFPNGPLSVKAARSRLVRGFPDDFQGYIAGHVPKYSPMHPEFDPQTKDRLIEQFFAEQRRLAAEGKPTLQFGISHSLNTRQAWSQFYSEYDGPRIRVYEIEIHGPLYDQWPVASHRQLLGTEPIEKSHALVLLQRFAERAYRRPVDKQAVEPMVRLFEQEMARGASAQEAILVAYQAILCSPGFLYLHQTPEKLDGYDQASRLSYFLWSAPPDEQLLDAAHSGAILDPAKLQAQTDRMLDDERVTAFVQQFTDAWLGLSKLGTMLPSQRAHPEYFVENLEASMRRETYLFVADALEHNRPLVDFLSGRHTFVNGPLARLYEIEGVTGHAFRRIELNSPERSGVLGMASVLTATANGIETSPIVRGVWLLDNILGTPSPPPPPDVEPIEPDIRGATTIREQLSLHREVSTCRACHARIDPLGFALESFDEIGRHREHYVRRQGRRRQRRLPIDTSGELPSGETFGGIVELRGLLLARKQQFATNLASKLLTYATGRLPSVVDRVEAERIAETLLADDGGFRTLVHRVVQSKSFKR